MKINETADLTKFIARLWEEKGFHIPLFSVVLNKKNAKTNVEQ